jgi:hypothetical protein
MHHPLLELLVSVCLLIANANCGAIAEGAGGIQ